MYFHIGGNQMIDVRRLVTMFKAHPKKTGKSNPLQQYYEQFIRVDAVEDKKIRCYVVTEDAVYATPISLETIVSRYQQLFTTNYSR